MDICAPYLICRKRGGRSGFHSLLFLLYVLVYDNALECQSDIYSFLFFSFFFFFQLMPWIMLISKDILSILLMTRLLLNMACTVMLQINMNQSLL